MGALKMEDRYYPDMFLYHFMYTGAIDTCFIEGNLTIDLNW